MRAQCGHALSSWKMKPEPTAAIQKGITTGYKEMVTQMHIQTRWPSTAIDLYSDIFRAPQAVYTARPENNRVLTNILVIFEKIAFKVVIANCAHPYY